MAAKDVIFSSDARTRMLRGVDIEAGKNGAGTIGLKVPLDAALYILNHKRAYLDAMARMRGVVVMVSVDESLAPGDYAIERLTTDPEFVAPEADALPVDDMPVDDLAFDEDFEDEEEDEDFDVAADDAGEVLRAIEEVTRPMTAREIEKALSQTDLDYRARRAAVAALKGFNIVMVVPK